MIGRLMDNPRPGPCGFVVNKARKMCPAPSAGSPMPESLTGSRPGLLLLSRSPYCLGPPSPGAFMRLPLIDPDKLTAEQRPLYDDMQAEIAENFQGFKSSGAKGALIGPFNPWLHEPQ